MAIHGPRKDLKKESKSITFYDTLTEEQKKNWKKVLSLTIYQMTGEAPMLDFIPEYLIKEAINGLYKGIEQEIKE